MCDLKLEIIQRNDIELYLKYKFDGLLRTYLLIIILNDRLIIVVHIASYWNHLNDNLKQGAYIDARPIKC